MQRNHCVILLKQLIRQCRTPAAGGGIGNNTEKQWRRYAYEEVERL